MNSQFVSYASAQTCASNTNGCKFENIITLWLSARIWEGVVILPGIVLPGNVLPGRVLPGRVLLGRVFPGPRWAKSSFSQKYFFLP